MESYRGVLNEQEIIDAIIEASEKKLAHLARIEYNKKLMKPPIVENVSSQELFNKVMLKLNEKVESKGGVVISVYSEIKIYKLLSLYFTNNPEFEQNTDINGRNFSLKKGLMIYGNVGCGKTTLMKLFRSNPKFCYAVFPCIDISNEYKKHGSETIDLYSENFRISKPEINYRQTEAGVCFDDLGTETSSKHFGNESNVMADIILSRYAKEVDSCFNTHVTTNLTPDDIEACYGLRLRSRMREIFNIISFPVDSKDKRI